MVKNTIEVDTWGNLNKTLNGKGNIDFLVNGQKTSITAPNVTMALIKLAKQVKLVSGDTITLV